MTKLIRNTVLLVVFLVVISNSVIGWWANPEIGSVKFNLLKANDHKELTNQAILAVDNNDTNNNYAELTEFGNRVRIRSAAGDLDFEASHNVQGKKTGYINS